MAGHVASGCATFQPNACFVQAQLLLSNLGAIKGHMAVFTAQSLYNVGYTCG